MGWYTVAVAHDGMQKGLIVRLYDTDDVKRRVERGFLKPSEPPAWNVRVTAQNGAKSREVKSGSED